uniref:PKD_channel domain-containing protein n=1 Tax=Macrostomum lignano TaxID=282301 RepID=A0A1I8JRW9_9PLAT
CFNESEIPDPAADFKGRYIDNLPVMFDHRVYLYYNIYFKYHQSDGPFRYLKWEPCLLFDTMFRCPLMARQNYLPPSSRSHCPKNCYEANRMIHWEQLDTMTIFGAMGNFRQVASINQVTSKVLMSSRNSHSWFLNTLCTHQTTAFTHCPPFEAESLLDPNSYFNNVVDEDFQWIIFDIGSHKHISLLKLFINRMDLSAMRFLEVFVSRRSAATLAGGDRLPQQQRREGTANRILQEATMAEKMLWCAARISNFITSYIYSECSPHQRTRWVMIRMKVNSDLLEMKYMMGFDWLKFPEISRILVTNLEVFETPLDMMNCLTMHHPPMGPENADYWEDLYSFDGSGQPQEPPVFTQTHPQFTLPLNTHDSVHPDERFLQEDWDEHPRGQSCYEWKEALGPIKDSSCKRAVYFRVDNDTGEVIHYPDFGRSYGLAVDMQNCQECKAFEFSQNSFCRLHFISYSLNTMYAYESGTVYGRKSDTMTTSNPFTWNNPYHPYYRMLQDLLEETGFFRVPAANRTTKPRSVPPRADPGSAASSSIPHHIAAILGGSSAAKSKPRNAAQKQRQQVGPSQVSDPQPAAPAAAPQALLWASALGPLQPGGLLLPTTGLALLDQLLIQHHQHHQVLQLLQSQHQSGFPLGTTGNPLAYGFWMPTDEGVLAAAAAAAASTEPSAPAADEPKDSAVKLVDEDAMEVRDEEKFDGGR